MPWPHNILKTERGWANTSIGLQIAHHLCIEYDFGTSKCGFVPLDLSADSVTCPGRDAAKRLGYYSIITCGIRVTNRCHAVGVYAELKATALQMLGQSYARLNKAGSKVARGL